VPGPAANYDGEDEALHRDAVSIRLALEVSEQVGGQLDTHVRPWHFYGTVACVSPGSPSFGNLP
jgi:hypothetical protein